MARKPFRSQASSSRAFGDVSNTGAFGANNAEQKSSTSFGLTSPLSYVYGPPDLSHISDSGIVVTFKNLSKKDSVTKFKALEELQNLLFSDSKSLQAIEDGVLEAWIKLYPRTSIDNSPRVRSQAHSLQGRLTLISGKRMAKYLPVIVGAWLAGLYDNDRSVSRATQDSFNKAFITDEKRNLVWSTFSAKILGYCRDVILKESASTLSDSRTVSPDDSDAKYGRVVASCIFVLAKLIRAQDPSTVADQASTMYVDLIQDRALWKFAGHKDSGIRKALYSLLGTCMETCTALAEPVVGTLSTHVLSKALTIDQRGSALEYSQALLALTSCFPSAWTEQYSGKRSAIKSLQMFISKGSKGAASQFWQNMASVFDKLPDDFFPAEVTDENDLLASIRDGINQRSEHKSNLEVAWACYAICANRIIANVKPPSAGEAIAKRDISLMLDEYLQISGEGAQWNFGPSGASICSNHLAMLNSVSSRGIESYLITKIDQLADAISKNLRSSLDSKSTSKSASRVSKRWADLSQRLSPSIPSLSPFLRQAHVDIVRNAMEITVESKGGYAEAAASMEYLVRQPPSLAPQETEDGYESICAFFSHHMLKLLLSNSSKHLIPTLCVVGESCHEDGVLRSTLTAIITSLGSSDDQQARNIILHVILDNLTENLCTYLAQRCDFVSLMRLLYREGLGGDDQSWSAFSSLVSVKGLVPETEQDAIFNELVLELRCSSKESSAKALNCIDLLLKNGNISLRRYLRTDNELTLTTELMIISTWDLPLASKAQEDLKILEQIFGRKDNTDSLDSHTLTFLRHSFRYCDSQSIPVQALITKASSIFESLDVKVRPQNVIHFLPTSDEWKDVLQPLMMMAPNISLSLFDPLVTLAFFPTHPADVSASQARPGVDFDEEGFSLIIRIAYFLKAFLQKFSVFEFLDTEACSELAEHLSIVFLLISDGGNVQSSNHLWATGDSETQREVATLILELPAITQQLFESRRSDGLLASIEKRLYGSLAITSNEANYRARVLTRLIDIDHSCWEEEADRLWLTKFESTKNQENSLSLLSLLLGYHDPPSSVTSQVSRFVNELVSDLTGVRNPLDQTDVLASKIVYLNALAAFDLSLIEGIPSQRLMFLMKTVMSWLAVEELPASLILSAEILRLLNNLFPSIKELYGSHWAMSIQYLQKVLSKIVFSEPEKTTLDLDPLIPGIYRSLKLFATLRGLKDANEDLEESLGELSQTFQDLLLRLLDNLQGYSDQYHTPLRVCNEMLCRLIGEVATEQIGQSSQYFRLLYSKSTIVQSSLFTILHEQIPKAQGIVSIEAALSKSTAKLPLELVSMIIEVPDIETLVETETNQLISLALRGYLLSWILIFDHFSESSFKVRMDYLESLNQSASVEALLAFIFSVLFPRKPIEGLPKFNSSKVSGDIATYVPDDERPPTSEVYHLLAHLYYLCLLRTPNLTKNWYLLSTSRSLSQEIFAFTEKKVSPILTTSELSDVTNFFEDPKNREDEAFSVKVLPKAREVQASYAVEDQVMKILIELPAAWPLGQAKVEGVNRVAVDERKWTSWNRTVAGVIAFGNGSVVDGLQTWQKNVSGALKGQTECAICYSVVSSDRELPTKRCRTCKHLFHGTCLFKWFKSSNSSSCPLCRNSFNYG